MNTLDDLDRLERSATRQETPCGDGAMVWRAWGDAGARPLVLLHGGYGSWRHWARTIPHFALTRRVVVPDLPGLGESATPPAPHVPDGIAAIVTDGIDAVLGPGAAYDLAGFSFGGMLSGHVAVRHGARVGTLVLVGAGGLGLPRQKVELVKAIGLEGEARREANRTNLARFMIADPSRVDDLAIAIQDWNTTHARLKSRRLSAMGTLPAALRDVRARLGAIWGSLDAASLPYIDEREALLRDLRPDIDFRRVEGAGHWVAYEAPQRFNALLEAMIGA